MSGDRNTTLAILPGQVGSFLKGNYLTKPGIFSKSSSILDHLKSVTKFLSCVHATTDLEKVLVLWETLDDSTQKEIIFDQEYDDNSENFDWLCKKLKAMFPSKSSKASDLINLNQIRQNGRTLQEFVSHIKQECAKRKANFTGGEIQSVAVKIFISGLENELFRRTLKQLQPTNIDSAFNAIKILKQRKKTMSEE